MADPLPLRIAPSLLACDFTRIGEEIAKVEAGGADWLHLDVMDGHFVPNLTIGPPVIASIAKVARIPLDVHLMIEDPWQHADAFLVAGADVLTFHVEVADRGDARALIQKIRGRGKKAAMAINPDGDVARLQPFLAELDMVLVMSLFPGFGGQKFIESMLPKIAELRRRIDERGLDVALEVDGGIAVETVGRAAEAGADVFVAGNAVFRSDDYAEAIAALRRGAA